MSSQVEGARFHNLALESLTIADPEWDREVFGKAAIGYRRAFPALPIVSDGKRPTGRGTTLFDAFRVKQCGRVDLLGIKTGRIDPSNGKWPSHYSIMTALGDTLDAVMQPVTMGASIPTLFVVRDPRDPQAVWVTFRELGAMLRQHGSKLEFPPDEGYRRFCAPAFGLGWSQRSSGIKRFANGRAEHAGKEYPFLEPCGSKLWAGPTRIGYRELRVNAHAAGITRDSGNWVRIYLHEVADFVNSQPWDKLAMLHPEYR